MKCPICGKNFEPRAAHQKYCSDGCRQQANNLNHFGKFDYPPRAPFEFDCKHCGKHVVTAPFGDWRSVYCSEECWRKGRHERRRDREV